MALKYTLNLIDDTGFAEKTVERLAELYHTIVSYDDELTIKDFELTQAEIIARLLESAEEIIETAYEQCEPLSVAQVGELADELHEIYFALYEVEAMLR